jgi:succinoglycan biosynthesis protein ExoI
VRRRFSILVGVALSATPLAAKQEHNRTLIGTASVSDGDTIVINDIRIRINGVDAPERGQRCQQSRNRSHPCAKEAAIALDEFLARSRPTKCALLYKDHERWVADCFRHDGKDVGEWLVANGHALDWPKFSKGKFAKFQMQARRKHLGIWQGHFELPCIIRARRKHAQPKC